MSPSGFEPEACITKERQPSVTAISISRISLSISYLYLASAISRIDIAHMEPLDTVRIKLFLRSWDKDLPQFFLRDAKNNPTLKRLFFRFILRLASFP
ncbi:hypothetical protein CEXT_499021 [Caerostris extrusa]|uniref:Uncharacterized protein n=1 Tax=Caerostris extrusa TaxID=172846 RepID=A0AAV4TKK4_CAEEX|nr:hypothetical protein CEXT_499021 [Caerostris extrusa]